MRILGIETSCDETGVTLIEASGDFGADFRFHTLGNALLSQIAIHAPYGGVFPNLAKREHAKNLVPIMMEALAEAGELHDGAEDPDLESLRTILARESELFDQLGVFLSSHKKPAIDAIAVTHGPGLEPALWVGVNFARALALAWDVPIVATDHMEGHIVLSMMREDRLADIEFPILSLLISGGHTEIVLSRAWHIYEKIGATRDDAAGEAFDKVARLMDLPYPGGPEISRLAALARQEKIPREIILPRPMLHEHNYDFSFSGLKTAVRRVVEANTPLSDEMKKELAREFEDAVADVLVGKTMRAVEEFGARAVVVGGGVSANTHIRHCLAEALAKAGQPATLLVPPRELSTDNALMIAIAGYFRAIKGEFADPTGLKASGNLTLA